MEYSTIEGKKLNSINYECQGYRYVKSRKYGNSIYIKCALFRSNSCACTGKIDKQTNLLELNTQHNHDASMHRSEKIIVSNTIKRKAEVSSANLREVFNDTCRGLNEASSVTFKSLESSLFKRRRILQPKMSALEFDSLLQGSFTFTNHLQTIIDMDGIAVIWGSSTMMNNLSNSSTIQFDATFKVVPRLFFQLFTIFINFRGHTLPALHVLMTRKTERLYTAVLLTIRRLIPELNPTFAMGDFEQAPRNAMTAVFPSITIIGCWFHFTKAIYENVQKLGLSKLYMRNHDFSMWIRKIMALAFLPEEEIASVYYSLEMPSIGINEAERELISKFRKYFHRTWLIGYEHISVFIYQDATNNGAESYHKTLKSIIKTPHPNVWKFIACLDNIISDNDTELQRLIQDLETTRGPNCTTKAKLISRNRYKEKYINGSLNQMEYLSGIATTIGRANLQSEIAEDEDTSNSESQSAHTNQEGNICHICLLGREENFALLHEDCVHGAFCQPCAERIIDMKVLCPICKAEVKGILKVFW